MSKNDFVNEAVKTVAEMMAIAAITAPKARGENFVEVKILQGEVLKELAIAMEAFGKKVNKKSFDRDGRNVANSDAVVLIGLKEPNSCSLDCGACGFETCAEFLSAQRTHGEFSGPICAHRLLDMGIAIGSAVKTASLFNVDNRVMYRIGAVARDMKLVDWEYVMGIPLSVTSKNIFFDR